MLFNFSVIEVLFLDMDLFKGFGERFMSLLVFICEFIFYFVDSVYDF